MFSTTANSMALGISPFVYKLRYSEIHFFDVDLIELLKLDNEIVDDDTCSGCSANNASVVTGGCGIEMLRLTATKRTSSREVEHKMKKS